MIPTRALRLACCSAVCVFSSVLYGAEVVVQNDSVTEGSTGAIQAGFAAGESAAAWLTSPCDGTIVAVQIYWASLSGTTGQSFEDSITIYSGGAFPNPGAVAVELIAPVMTDSVLNEFRYLNEEQTVPISVPVVEDQTFVVSFKFATTPSPTNGPSVVTDTNGCQPGKNAIDCLFPCFGWINACSLGVSGDFFIRAVVDCPSIQPAGACCFNDGDCLNAQQQDDCEGDGGAWQGANSQCSLGICERACCFLPSGCVDLIPDDCDLAGGFVQAPGNLCDDPGFECFPTGACCNTDGSCDNNVIDVDCAAGGGTFQGDGSLCSGVSCPQPEGACCLSSGSCLVLEHGECDQIPTSLFWAGGLTTCADADMSGTADACEGGPACPGGTLAECGDTNNDNKRDDACLWYDCASGLCSSTGRTTQADIGGSNGACPVDGTCDGNDRFHALNCFANSSTTGATGYPCEDAPPAAINVDAVGANGSCVLDGTCDGNDAFAALNCFSDVNTMGSSPFPCGCGPQPQVPAPRRGSPAPDAGTALMLRASRTARPGEVVDVRVHLAEAAEALRGYQLHMDASGGTDGALILVDVSIDDARKDSVFAAAPGPWAAFNRASAQMVAGMDHPQGIPAPADGYLATFTYRVSEDASGRFLVELRHDGAKSEGQERTFLFGPYGRLLPIVSAPPVAIEILPGSARHPRG
jgi:hypothetical protein